MTATLLLALAVSTAAPPSVQRFALVAGANSGGARRPRLSYAVSDAERFEGVLLELGGVAASNAILLRQPGVRDLEAALDSLRDRVEAARRAGAGSSGRTEVLVYYSGHADETGLLLGEERYSYRELRDRVDSIPADVRIAVLDACASGAITRLKGGQPRPAFLVDASSSMHGHAFLTSSSADEAAQESDRVGASFFTHYLISGLRGAADASGDGKVTLSEAYQFAFRETLGRTVETRGGAQHPSYDINLSGTGDVVMTDVRDTSAGLVLGEELVGRCYVRDAAHALVVELQKPKERAVELGLAPGAYEVRCQDEAAAFVAHPVLENGKRVALGARDFSPARRDATLARGGDAQSAEVGELAGRHRLEGRLGLAAAWHPSRWGVGPTSNGSNLGLAYTYWLGPRVAISLSESGFDRSSSQLRSVSSEGVVVDDSSSGLSSFLLSVRRDLPLKRRLRSYLSLGLGRYSLYGHVTTNSALDPRLPLTPSNSRSSSVSVDGGAFGFQIASGLDLQTGHDGIFGLRVGYDRTGKLPTPPGPPQGVSRVDVSLSFGWLFGRGK
jgi:hypothetical protein